MPTSTGHVWSLMVSQNLQVEMLGWRGTLLRGSEPKPERGAGLHCNSPGRMGGMERKIQDGTLQTAPRTGPNARASGGDEGRTARKMREKQGGQEPEVGRASGGSAAKLRIKSPCLPGEQ